MFTSVCLFVYKNVIGITTVVITTVIVIIHHHHEVLIASNRNHFFVSQTQVCRVLLDLCDFFFVGDSCCTNPAAFHAVQHGVRTYQGSSQKKIKEGVVLRSKDVCGFSYCIKDILPQNHLSHFG